MCDYSASNSNVSEDAASDDIEFKDIGGIDEELFCLCKERSRDLSVQVCLSVISISLTTQRWVSMDTHRPSSDSKKSKMAKVLVPSMWIAYHCGVNVSAATIEGPDCNSRNLDSSSS